MSDCPSGSCDFQPKIDARTTERKRLPEEQRYTELWNEVELPKLLKEKKR